MAIRDNLSTSDRLLKWGFVGDVLCVFCRGGIEGRNHLFFDCSFCRRVWRGNLENCLVSNIPYSWDDIVERGEQEWKGRGLKAILCKLVLSSSVYNIWRERNSNEHGNQIFTEERLVQKISGLAYLK